MLSANNSSQHTHYSGTLETILSEEFFAENRRNLEWDALTVLRDSFVNSESRRKSRRREGDMD